MVFLFSFQTLLLGLALELVKLLYFCLSLKELALLVDFTRLTSFFLVFDLGIERLVKFLLAFITLQHYPLRRKLQLFLNLLTLPDAKLSQPLFLVLLTVCNNGLRRQLSPSLILFVFS